MSTDYLTINGTQVQPPLTPGQTVAIEHSKVFARGACPELTFARVIGALAALPDSWSGKTAQWLHGATLGTATAYFTGDVVSYRDRFDEDSGWTRDYRALGLSNRCDWVPVTDSNTLSDVAQFNLPVNSPQMILSREGRTIGQCILDLLSMAQNVASLASYGIGNFSSAGTGGEGQAVLSGTDLGYSGGYYSVASVSVVGTGGSGYTTAPTVVLAGGGGYGASYTANVSGGVITSFTQISAGSGYFSPPTVIISTLPSLTITDLVPLILTPPTGGVSTPGSYVGIIPPFPVSFSGERILQSIQGVLQNTHPNYWVHIDPAGNFRFYDQRLFTSNTVTLNNSADPRWIMPTLTRDHSDCYSQLVVRGGLDVTGATLGLVNGGLAEDFAGWYTAAGVHITTNAAAKAAWSPAMFQQLSLQGGQDQGTCVCTSTTTVNITSSNTSLTFAANQLDQTDTGQHGQITVFLQTITSVQQSFTARVIGNTAMTAGGTSTLTLDRALPGTTYTSYYLYALTTAGNVVWRRYSVTNAAVGQAMQQFFPYPFAFRNSNGTAAALTTAPVCTVFNGLNQASIGVSVDPSSGTITTVSPTSLLFGGGVVTPPTDVQLFVPVANGSLSVSAPAGGGYAGTLHTVEGINRTKTITVREWTDYSQSSYMQSYCNEVFDAMKDVIVEGDARYLGLPTTYLSPGQAISITGSTYTTGWESIALPVASVEVEFNAGPGGTTYVTTLSLSNRKQRYSSQVFLRPPARGQAFGTGNAQDAGVINQASFRMQRGAARDLGGFGPPTDEMGNPISLQQSQKEFASHFAPPTDDWDRAEKQEWQNEWLARSQDRAIRPFRDLTMGARGQFAHLGDPIPGLDAGDNAGGFAPAQAAGVPPAGGPGGEEGPAAPPASRAPIARRDPDAGYADQSPEAKAARAAAREKRATGIVPAPVEIRPMTPEQWKDAREAMEDRIDQAHGRTNPRIEATAKQAQAVIDAENKAVAEQQARDREDAATPPPSPAPPTPLPSDTPPTPPPFPGPKPAGKTPPPTAAEAAGKPNPPAVDL